MCVSKVCFKCLIDKPLTEYYKHSKMSDGHLNKCKECSKKESKIISKEKRKDPIWIEKEKVRSREKYYRLGYKDLYKPSFKNKKEAINNYKNKYPEKVLARNYSSSLKATVLGNHLHHWSYNKEHFKDVIELSVKDHQGFHRFLVYDQERYMYRRTDNNELLDTKELHYSYFIEIQSKI